jgi:hypothetical protein
MSRNIRGLAVLASVLSLGAIGTACAAEYVPPPIMPVPNAWQGRAQAVVRVLDKLDAHVETLALKAGETGSYKSLSVTVRSCMDRPDGLPRDSGAFLDIQDRRGAVPSFSGWTFSGEPSVGVFESPIYGVQLVTCQGDMVAPAAPPLPPPVPPPPSMMPNPPPSDPNNTSADAPAAASAPSDQSGDPKDAGASDGDPAQPDAVYPDGAPPAATPPQPPHR